MCVNNLLEVVTWKREAGSQTRDLLSHKSNALTMHYATMAAGNNGNGWDISFRHRRYDALFLITSRSLGLYVKN